MQDYIIQFLKESQGYLSGEDISRRLKISRAGIWKNIEELRKEGYDIIAVPHLGYKLNSYPDKLYPREIQNNLKTKIFGKNIIHFDEIGSTMDEAFSLALKGEAEGTVVCAETQTKGRGRLGRSWMSPKSKGIYASIILRPKLPPVEVAKLTLLAAVAVSEGIEKATGIKAKIKWPNDLLINNKKLAGILTELNAEIDRVRFVVIGFGINVNTTASQLPLHATSLKSELNKNVSRIELMKEILHSMELWCGVLKKSGFAPIIERWKKSSATLGKRIRIDNVEGLAVDLDESGALIIKNDKGEFIRRISGDVVQI